MSFSPLPRALLERDDLGRHGVAARGAGRAVAARRCRGRAPRSRTASALALGGDGVQAAHEQLALLGVDDAEGELDSHWCAYCHVSDARHVVDPAAYTPPYDHALCAALAQAGADVELVTSALPARRGAAGATATRCASASTASPRQGPRPALGAPGPAHPRHAALRRAREADVVHFQWLAVQPLDEHLLRAYSRPRVITAHDVLPREPLPGPARRPARALRAHGRDRRPLRARARAAGRRARRARAARARHPARRSCAPRGDAPLPPELARRTTAPSCSASACCGPYKGIDVLARGVAGDRATPSCGSSARRAWTSRRCAPPPRRACASWSASSPTARPRRSSAAPTSPSCPTARSSSPACSSPRWASGCRSCSPTSAASPRSRRPARPSSSRPATPRRCTRR